MISDCYLSHRMDFGPRLLPEGDGVCFRLWAPSAEKVEIGLLKKDEAWRIYSMDRAASGWFQLTVIEAEPGDLYQFRVDTGLWVPDPASRFQPEDVHGPSEVVSPAAFAWEDLSWKGRPWEEAVIYELHVGAFSREGTFQGVSSHLQRLADLGVTAIELMPVASFPGKRNWGYDGVLPFAPESCYGRPEDLKRLIQQAHHLGMMVFLDVVYNHFGPEGNYLYEYGKTFFSSRHKTPWGDAINYDGPGSRTVRDFFIHNALYWLEEFHLDGLRLDAVHSIFDDSSPHILKEIAGEVHNGPGKERHIHLILENDANEACYLERDSGGRPYWYAAQWNDDIHHSLHCLLTGEDDGYYGDYGESALYYLGRCLTEGFAYQGEPSPYRDGQKRGESSKHLPLTSFVSFLQNHDQVGNRAFGERLSRLTSQKPLRAAVALVLLAPSIPLLFMGEEAGADNFFPFFCDFGADLAPLVTEGRRREFAYFEAFKDPEARRAIPDPADPRTFQEAVLDWDRLKAPHNLEWLDYYRCLLSLRQRVIVPMLGQMVTGKAGYRVPAATRESVVFPYYNAAEVRAKVLLADWPLQKGGSLKLYANLGPGDYGEIEVPEKGLIFSTAGDMPGGGTLPAWSVSWFAEQG